MCASAPIRQTVENQVSALTKVAEVRGWQIVGTFSVKNRAFSSFGPPARFA
jgi:hypothetical protein